MFLKKYVQFRLIFLFFILPILFGSHESLGAEKKSLTWGTTASTSGQFPYFVVTAKILNEKIPEINITVRATGGVVHNTRLLEKSEIDIGAIDTKTAWEAIHGKESFEGKPFMDLRLLYVIAANPFQFVVSEKSGVKDIYGLEGKLFCPGMLGGSAEKTAMDICRILGVRPKLRHSSYADGVEQMKNEAIVGIGKYGVPDSSILDIASVMKIRVLSFSDADIEKIVNNVAGLRKVVVQSGMYPGVGEFKTVANEWCDYVRKDFQVELAYKILKIIWENRVEIKRSTAATFTGDQLVEESLGVKVGYMHHGAIKFYREIGFTVPKILVPPEMGEK